MKKIGIIGAMSHKTTMYYYGEINRRINERWGFTKTAEPVDMIIKSMNSNAFMYLMENAKWGDIERILRCKIFSLILDRGCQYVALVDGTMDVVDDWYFRCFKLEMCPFIHADDCVAKKIKEAGIRRAALLGTYPMMVNQHIKKRLEEENGLEMIDLFPNKIKAQIGSVVLEGIRHGEIGNDEMEYIKKTLIAAFCERKRDDEEIGVILGTMELAAILKNDTYMKYFFECHNVRLFDATEAHIDRLVELCLS